MMSSYAISIDVIRAMSAEAAVKAAAKRQIPLMVTEEDVSNGPGHLKNSLRYMPFLGDYCPEGWEKVRVLFVDSSGFGAEYEAALTQDQFFAEVQANFGYAIIEAGQFQVKIAEYKKEKK